MAVAFVGVRHHSPACARLVRDTIRRLRPAYVLVEGPADVNGRMAELLLGHEPPVAIYSYHRDAERVHASWTPFCAYSPEWVALNEGRAAGAELRFVDLPAWHPAFADRGNRYADAELRYAEVAGRLCREFAVDNTDILWDHLFEIDPDDTARRLDAYFDLLRGGAEAGEDDAARESYMAAWIRAAEADAGDRPVVVVTGGFHKPALERLAETGGTAWPDVPEPPEGSTGGSFLVPYSFRRLDAFTGYQAGMPSPEYYQRLWEGGPEKAASALVETVVARLRERRRVVSTADLVAARTLTDGLTRLRGHRAPARTDLLDGLVSALVNDDLDRRLPWTSRGRPAPGAHPVVVEMVAALSGSRVGRLHRDTPAPPLVHDAAAELERLGLDRDGPVALTLTTPRGLERSRALHRLRVLAIPGVVRRSGPATGADPVLEEHWVVDVSDDDGRRASALIEAGAYGPTLAAAAAAVLDERMTAAGNDMGGLADVLFDAALCGCADQSGRIAETIAAGIAGASHLAALGAVLEVALGLWRHDRVLGTARSPLLGTVVAEGVVRVLWLVEGVRGGPGPADLDRLRAVAAVRDALVHARGPLGLDRDAALGVARRVAARTDVPPDLRGAAFGLGRALGDTADPARALRGAAGPETFGDWLAGLFALARQEVLDPETAVLDVLDELVGAMGDDDFLVALPALRQAFEFFPPREREAIARGLLERHGARGSSRALLRTDGPPLLIAEARALEARVDRALHAAGLEATP
ncbi:hypothetical protein BZB76_6284 [Actinomadura pelletieri DSM 43383]|uniref:Uncharacterized protein n=1 Tax=Actinomadura pelletieri DSM 43383 TaxID=1120940 RepID=A0A495QBS7_9ACTN|nr:DUF5682 family protein [Actinomadura pelletieri]RKS69145.1 hypothetical protein BZB76_6284 [Actinomadura pelletieri DSM 43383]